MKANELMIGDWVRITDDDTDMSFVSQISGISSVGNIYARMPEGETAYPFAEDCAEPIPITPEILEKNGFTKSERYEVWKTISDDYELRITPWRVAVIFLDEDGSDKEEFSAPRPKYVHELQHAMRLCGIEKEIDLC